VKAGGEEIIGCVVRDGAIRWSRACLTSVWSVGWNRGVGRYDQVAVGEVGITQSVTEFIDGSFIKTCSMLVNIRSFSEDTERNITYDRMPGNR